MPIWDKLDSTRTARPEVVAIIDELLKTHAIESVHYVGYAHEPILRLLHRYLGSAFTVMDFADRYHSGAAFLWEGPGDYPGQIRPDWLEGVSFYEEGAPDSELLIWDMPWTHHGQLSDIIKRHAPNCLLLVDEACAEALHPAYTWEVFPFCALGTVRTALAPASGAE